MPIFSKTKTVKISPVLHTQLQHIKVLAKCTTMEQAINYLIETKNRYAESENLILEKEKIYAQIEKKIAKEITYLKKQMVLQNNYSRDINYLQKESTELILKKILTLKKPSESDTESKNEEIKDLQMQLDEALNECELADKKISELNMKLNNFRFLFKLKNGLISKNYEAKISEEEYKKMFGL